MMDPKHTPSLVQVNDITVYDTVPEIPFTCMPHVCNTHIPKDRTLNWEYRFSDYSSWSCVLCQFSECPISVLSP